MRVRAIKRRDLAKHRNPDYRITIRRTPSRAPVDYGHVLPDLRGNGRGAPVRDDHALSWPGYAKLAAMLNRARVDCRRLHTFNMDEYADQDGRIAPATWEFGFGYAFKKYFYAELDPKLRPPERTSTIFTDRNLKDYGRMLADLGGADICYSGPGWTGHLAFIEPDAPEFAGTFEEWKRTAARVHAEPLHARAAIPCTAASA